MGFSYNHLSHQTHLPDYQSLSLYGPIKLKLTYSYPKQAFIKASFLKPDCCETAAKGQKRGPWSLLLYCASDSTDKIQPLPRGSEHMDPQQRDESILTLYNSSMSAQSEENCAQKRLLCFFIPQYPSPLRSTAQSQSWKQPSSVHAFHHLTTTAS